MKGPELSQGLSQGATLVSGPIFQVAWIVDDIAAAEELLRGTMGVQKWTRFDDVEFGPDMCTLRGEPADFTIHVSLGYAGAQQLELIQPVSGHSLYAEDLARRGPGLHHLAYVVDDLDAAVMAAVERGLSPVQRGSFPGEVVKFAYFEGGAGGATYLELLELSPDMVTLFDSLAASG